MTFQFPNESAQYRAARDVLLQRELELRRTMEDVAAQLRQLPSGGEVPEDYVFERIGAGGTNETVRLSALFGASDTLMIYHMMFPRDSRDDRSRPATGAWAKAPLAEGPCPSCTALIDMWEGTMPHFEGLGGNLAIVAKARPVDWRISPASKAGKTRAFSPLAETVSAATMAAKEKMANRCRS